MKWFILLAVLAIVVLAHARDREEKGGHGKHRKEMARVKDHREQKLAKDIRKLFYHQQRKFMGHKKHNHRDHHKSHEKKHKKKEHKKKEHKSKYGSKHGKKYLRFKRPAASARN